MNEMSIAMLFAARTGEKHAVREARHRCHMILNQNKSMPQYKNLMMIQAASIRYQSPARDPLRLSAQDWLCAIARGQIGGGERTARRLAPRF